MHKDILMFLFEHLHQGIKCSTIYRKERDQLDHELDERQQKKERRKTFNEVAVKFYELHPHARINWDVNNKSILYGTEKHCRAFHHPAPCQYFVWQGEAL